MTLAEQAAAYDTAEIAALVVESELGLIEGLIARLIDDNPGTSDADARAAILSYWMF